MDIDAIRKGKGKHNNKGKGKSKGKHKGKGYGGYNGYGYNYPKGKGKYGGKGYTITTIRLGMATLLEKAAKEKTKDAIKEKERTKENK